MGGSNFAMLLRSSARGSLFRSFLHDFPKPPGEPSANYGSMRCNPFRDHATLTPPTAYMAARNPYDVLGVNKTASASEIKNAYYRLAKRFHPDTNGANAAAGRKFREINEAYEALKDRQNDSGYYDQDSASSTEQASQGRRRRRKQPFEGGPCHPSASYHFSTDFNVNFHYIFRVFRFLASAILLIDVVLHIYAFVLTVLDDFRKK